MPYCHSCGEAYSGEGIYCTTCYSSAQSQSLVRQSYDNQLSTAWTPNTVAQMMRDPSLHYYFNSVTINRVGTVTATMNNERTRCACCNYWFGNDVMLRQHRVANNSGCTDHVCCFGSSHNVVHATRHRHNRCFVLGCRSVIGSRRVGPILRLCSM